MHDYTLDNFLKSYMGHYADNNDLTEEKLNLIEKIINRTFPKYHKNQK